VILAVDDAATEGDLQQLVGLLVRPGGAGDVADGLKHREFVAAEPRHDIVEPHRAAQPGRYLEQQRVARRVAERIVDLLEAVEIEHQDSDAGVGAASAMQRLADAVVEERAVREPGERVVQRLVLVQLGLADQRLLGVIAGQIGVAVLRRWES